MQHDEDSAFIAITSRPRLWSGCNRALERYRLPKRRLAARTWANRAASPRLPRPRRLCHSSDSRVVQAALADAATLFVLLAQLSQIALDRRAHPHLHRVGARLDPVDHRRRAPHSSDRRRMLPPRDSPRDVARVSGADVPQWKAMQSPAPQGPRWDLVFIRRPSQLEAAPQPGCSHLSSRVVGPILSSCGFALIRAPKRFSRPVANDARNCRPHADFVKQVPSPTLRPAARVTAPRSSIGPNRLDCRVRGADASRLG